MKKLSQNTISTMIAGSGIYAGSHVDFGRLHRVMPCVGRTIGNRPAITAQRVWPWSTVPETPEGSNLRADSGNTRSACTANSAGSDGSRTRRDDVKQVFLPVVKLRRLAAASQAAPLVFRQALLG